MKYTIETRSGAIFQVAAEDMLCDPLDIMQWPNRARFIRWKVDATKEIFLNLDSIESVRVEKLP